MSNYGPPPGSPQDPYGQAPTGQPWGPPPPPPGYGQPPAHGGYGGYGAPQPPYGYGTQPAYAHWGLRVGAFLLDGLFSAVSGLLLWIGYGILIGHTAGSTSYDPNTGVYESTGGDVPPIAVVLILIGGLMLLGFGIWNLCIRQGTTGYSLGKSIVGIKLVKEQTMQPAGGWLCFGRQLLHILDEAPWCIPLLYVGFLWPIWDAKKQTFADKIVNTIVVVDKK